MFKKTFKWFSDRYSQKRGQSDSKITIKYEDTPKSINFTRLNNIEGSYDITAKVPFSKVAILKPTTVDIVFDFAYKMTFGESGEHRDHRSGGNLKRKKGEIFANTFQGKISECAVCNFFHTCGITIVPDFSTYGLGEWDSVDLSVNGKEISVKSTKHYGQLLLLETKDWNEKAEYIPNIKKGNATYDYFLLVRINPSCEDIMKKYSLLYKNSISKDDLYKIISTEEWSYDYAGWITGKELKYIIDNKYILPKSAKLNGKTTMDAENYYVQAACMHNMKELEDHFK